VHTNFGKNRLAQLATEVVDLGDAAGSGRAVVGVACLEAVVGVVVPEARGHRCERRGHLLAVADRVVNVIHRVIDAVRIAGDGLPREPVEIVVAVVHRARTVR
jgi:hypothetical protein